MGKSIRIIALTLLCAFTTTAWGAMKTSTLTLTSDNAPHSSTTSNGITRTSDDGEIDWTIIFVGSNYNYSNELGAYYTDSRYISFKANHIPGKVHKVIVSASGYEVPFFIQGMTDEYYKILSDNYITDYTYEFYKQFDDNELWITIGYDDGSGRTRYTFSVKKITVIYDDEASRVEETPYQEVNSLSQLKDNDEVVLAYDNNSSYSAMAKYDFGYQYRSLRSITPQDGLLQGINSYCPNLLEKAEGSGGEQWYLRTYNGYIYTDNSGNMKVGNKQDIGNYGKISITIDPSTGLATIGFPTANKYLNVNSSNRFICSATPCPIKIFRKVTASVAETIDVTFKKKFGGWTSIYYKEKNLVVPDAFTAYGYSVSGGQGATSKSYAPGEVIPAGMAVILKLNDGDDTFDGDSKTITVEVTDEEGTPDPENALLGFDEASNTTARDGTTDGYEFFRLTLDAASTEGSIGFYWGAADGAPFQVGAHKAYLAVAKPHAPQSASLPLRIIPYLLGDANGDGQVNVVDVMVVVNYVLGNNPPIIKTIRSDVNFDKSINVTDVMGIVRIAIGN